MAGKEIDLGPTGKQVKENVARVRKARGLSFAELSRQLTEVGRPIPPLGLRRIEEGLRRVDVDDIFALATVLRVTPPILMLPATRGEGDMVKATGVGEVESVWLWAWGTWSGADGAVPIVRALPEDLSKRLGYDTQEGREFIKSQAPRPAHRRLEDLRQLATLQSFLAVDAQRRLFEAQNDGEPEEVIASLTDQMRAAQSEYAATQFMLSQELALVHKLYADPSAGHLPRPLSDDAS